MSKSTKVEVAKPRSKTTTEQEQEQEQVQEQETKSSTAVKRTRSIGFRKMAAMFGCMLSMGMVLVYLMGWGRAIPWGFGGWSVENKSGRVPEFDKFLNDNAKVLSDPDEVRRILPRFIELSKSITTDAECTQYYTTMLMKLANEGLDMAMAREREVLNRKIATSLSNDGSTSLGYVMKMRHILDAFVDAASLHAWPTIKSNLRQEL